MERGKALWGFLHGDDSKRAEVAEDAWQAHPLQLCAHKLDMAHSSA